MSAIAPLDRQVLSMRAGTAGGAPPLTRGQVASKLGVSTRQVRFSERRGLTGLRTAATESGCAAPVGGPFAVSGLGASPLMTLATASGAGALGGPGHAGRDGYVPARQAAPGVDSPLAALAHNGQSGPPWLIVLITVLFSVAIAGLLRELRSSMGAPPPTY
jgi:hypothetical protein